MTVTAPTEAATETPEATPMPEAVPLVDPATGEPILDPETGEQLVGVPSPEPIPMLDPETGQPMLDPETGEPLLAIPEPTPTPTPEPTTIQAISTSDDFKEAVAEKSETVGSMADSLDAMAIEIGTMRISLWDAFVAIGVVFVVIAAAWAVTKACHALISRFTRLDETQRLLTEKITTIVVWVASFLIAMDLLGIDLTALAVFSGAFGLAIGFGLQKTFGNLIAGIILLMDKSIKPGDVISVADQAGNESFGQIRKIGIRAISVVTRDRTEYLIPNENLMINQVVNWSYSSRDVRVKAPVGVSYDSDLGLVTKLLYQAVDDTVRVLSHPKPRVNIMEFGDSSVNFEVRFWIQDPEEGLSNIRSDVYSRIWELFHEHNVAIPYPQRDLNFRSNAQFDQLVAAITQRVKDGPKE